MKHGPRRVKRKVSFLPKLRLSSRGENKKYSKQPTHPTQLTRGHAPYGFAGRRVLNSASGHSAPRRKPNDPRHSPPVVEPPPESSRFATSRPVSGSGWRHSCRTERRHSGQLSSASSGCRIFRNSRASDIANSTQTSRDKFG
jgi:hypothetical protein